MITIRCRCGETYHADPAHVGRQIRCRCSRVLRVRPAPAASRRPDFIAGMRRRLRGAAAGMRERVRREVRRASTRRGVNPRHAHLVRVAAWSALGLAVLATAVLWGLGDRTWLGTALLFGPRWLLLLPVLAVVPAALLLRPRSLGPLLLALLVTAGPFMGGRTGVRSLFAFGGEPVLRVVSFNAEGRRETLMRLVRMMEQEDIAIGAVQECDLEPALFEQVFMGWHTHAGLTMCVVSRYPVTSAEPMAWEELAAVEESGLGGSGLAVHYRIAAPDGEIHLVNVHLETPRKGLESLRYGMTTARVADNTILRGIGSRRVFASLGDDLGGVLVLGDFNMPVESAIYRESWAALGNAFSRAGRGFALTRENGWIRVRIDHILYGRAWTARRSWMGPDLGSDHRPILADLTRRTAAAAAD